MQRSTPIDRTRRVLQPTISLGYFGESLKEPCGICSYCIERKQKSLSKERIKAISEELLSLIAYHPMTSQEICQESGYHEWEILHVLTLLLDAERIQVLQGNQYSINNR